MDHETQLFYSELFNINRGPPVIATPIRMEIPTPFLPGEVRAAIRSLPNGKAAGGDKITTDFLENCHDNANLLLAESFRINLRKGTKKIWRTIDRYASSPYSTRPSQNAC
uniref:Uncharacterized protein n=1 Tax=Caenorhabditis japonica TaxID=281687 RepID=A0A8R1EV57_CAEJA